MHWPSNNNVENYRNYSMMLSENEDEGQNVRYEIA